jgi:pantothenate kinase type III
LSESTAQLPQIGLEDRIDHIIGTNTIDCMRSGVVLALQA